MYLAALDVTVSALQRSGPRSIASSPVGERLARLTFGRQISLTPESTRSLRNEIGRYGFGSFGRPIADGVGAVWWLVGGLGRPRFFPRLKRERGPSHVYPRTRR